MKTEANIKFGQQVAKIRKLRGLSQEQLAYKCGFDRTYIGTIERGEKSATINSIVKLAQGLDILLKDLFDYWQPKLLTMKMTPLQKEEIRDKIDEIISDYTNLVSGIDNEAQNDEDRAYGGIIRAEKGKLVEEMMKKSYR